MKQSEVVIGKVYAIKVSGVLQPVRIDSNHAKSWPRRLRRYTGVNLRTGRTIDHITAARMQHELCGKDGKCFKRPGHVPGHDEDEPRYKFCERQTKDGVCGRPLDAHGCCGFESLHLNQTLEGAPR